MNEVEAVLGIAKAVGESGAGVVTALLAFLIYQSSKSAKPADAGRVECKCGGVRDELKDLADVLHERHRDHMRKLDDVHRDVLRRQPAA